MFSLWNYNSPNSPQVKLATYAFDLSWEVLNVSSIYINKCKVSSVTGFNQQVPFLSQTEFRQLLSLRNVGTNCWSWNQVTSESQSYTITIIMLLYPRYQSKKSLPIYSFLLFTLLCFPSSHLFIHTSIQFR